MKGNVFSQWLKEFCALVFTQSVQAFLLAIILTIVIVSISNGSGSGSKFYNVTTGGILAIIALTSISKMESLIKKLFGLESSITDTSMKGGKGGVLGTIAAMKMAKKVLNNGTKIASGVRDYRKSGKELKSASLDRNNKEIKLRNRYMESHSNNVSDSTNDSSGGNPSTSQTSSAQVSGSGPNNSTNLVQGTVSTQSTSNNSESSNSNNNKNPIKDIHKFEDDLEKIGKDYKDEIEKIKKDRRNAKRNIISGITESSGAVMGGISGAIVGAATGESITNTTGIGMGLGDMLGKKLVDIPADMYEHKKEMKDLNNKVKSYKKKIKASNEELERIRNQMNNFNAGDI